MKTNIRSSLLAFIILTQQSGFAQSAGNDSIVPLPKEDRQAIEKYLGKGVVGEAIPAPALADTTRYLNFNAAPRSFHVVSGPDKDKMERHQLAQMKQGAEGTTWRYDTGARFTFFITAKTNGDYIVTGAADNEEGVITQYLPGEPLMLQGLASGEERKTTHDMKVFDLSNPNKQTHAGTLHINYCYVGVYKVTVPAGTFDAVLIKWIFKGKIGPASLNDTQYRFLVADVGIVAAVEQMDVSAMLIYNKQRKVARVLNEKPKF